MIFKDSGQKSNRHNKEFKMKKTIALLVAVLFSFSLMAAEATKATPVVTNEVKNEVVAPIVAVCEKKALKACNKHKKHPAKVEKKFNCTCPAGK